MVQSSGRAPVIAPCLSALDRPPTYCSYSDRQMISAAEAVQRGEMSIRCACEEYGVPRSTLQDKASGKRSVNATTGSHRRLLSDEEESWLADFVCGCASMVYAKSRKEVLAIVQQILNLRGAETEMTKGWWDSFRRRHPELTLRHSEALSYAWAAANNTEVVLKYFDLWQQTMEENGLVHHPTQ